ncbi:MAG: pirin family protein [Methanomassiliicoccales archaeon]|nr:MAG: pirin family protein [Methanomassiliicoccales archaeon]
MTSFRSVTTVRTSRPTTDGAGVSLRRAFSRSMVETLDPFLLLDNFGSEVPEDYLAGFPMHPHRGIETVTYVLEGEVDHEDSIGNRGTIRAGEVQWMTAGRGILHQEMPRRSERLFGFQLWVNLPRTAKMMPPRYRDIRKEEIPEVKLGRGSSVKVIAGRYGKAEGPVKDLVVPVSFYDVRLGPGDRIDVLTDKGHSSFVFVYMGQAAFGPNEGTIVGTQQLGVLGKGEIVTARAGPGGTMFIMATGRPLREPVAWGGPIVMNTQDELEKAYDELEKGTFIDTR